jgi:hypothetical protein
MYPVSSYLGKTDSHKNSEVRGVLEPLGEMAERNRVAVLSITHFSKTGANNTTKAMHRFIGSIAFTGAPRAAFAVIEDVDDNGRMLFLHAKNNLAAPPQGLAYRLEQTIICEGIVASRLAWEGEPVAITANQALAAEAAGSDRSARQEAKEFLEGALAHGPMPAKEVQSMASEHGISPKTLRNAREAMGVKVSRDGFGPGSKSLWSAPYLPQTSIHAQQNNRASMDPEGKYGESEPSDDAGKVLTDPQDAHVLDEHLAGDLDRSDQKSRCEHCGDPERPGDPVQSCWVEGGEHLLHVGCQKEWLGGDLSIPPFLRRVS